ncbi:MAG: non-heme iron oxygenase ferredoxin subunit [Acidobacteria bacterium]|nr:non-heme iron oxygenase ferredoxin subunit [Acidobacteriota bacterium]
MANFVKVAAVSDVEPGKVKEYTVNGKVIALCNVEGEFYALDNVCLHRGGPLGQGYIDGDKVECPWHGWQYSVKTGAISYNPAMKVATYEVKVEGSDVLVAV